MYFACDINSITDDFRIGRVSSLCLLSTVQTCTDGDLSSSHAKAVNTFAEEVNAFGYVCFSVCPSVCLSALLLEKL